MCLFVFYSRLYGTSSVACKSSITPSLNPLLDDLVRSIKTRNSYPRQQSYSHLLREILTFVSKCLVIFVYATIVCAFTKSFRIYSTCNGKLGIRKKITETERLPSHCSHLIRITILLATASPTKKLKIQWLIVLYLDGRAQPQLVVGTWTCNPKLWHFPHPALRTSEMEINQHHQATTLPTPPGKNSEWLIAQLLIGQLSRKELISSHVCSQDTSSSISSTVKNPIRRSAGHGGLSPQRKFSSTLASRGSITPRLSPVPWLDPATGSTILFSLSFLLIGDLRLKCHVVALLKRRQGDSPTTMTPQLTEHPPQLSVFVTLFRCWNPMRKQDALVLFQRSSPLQMTSTLSPPWVFAPVQRASLILVPAIRPRMHVSQNKRMPFLIYSSVGVFLHDGFGWLAANWLALLETWSNIWAWEGQVDGNMLPNVMGLSNLTCR